jgi:hypothetical protein
MKWERGKGGKKEAYSESSGARYVYSEHTFKVCLPTGEWRSLGIHATLDEAKVIANDFELTLLAKELSRLNERTAALDKANDRAELRKLFDEVICDGGLMPGYNAFVRLKKAGIADIMIEAAMENVPPANREFLVRVFSMFYREGFK